MFLSQIRSAVLPCRSDFVASGVIAFYRMQPPPKQSPELASALTDDALHVVRDAAKFRAVSQRVDYDTFKNMARRAARALCVVDACFAGVCRAPEAVAGSQHAAKRCADSEFVRVLTRALHAGPSSAPSWLLGLADAAEPRRPQPPGPSQPGAPPATLAELRRAWASCAAANERLALLASLPPDLLASLCRSDLPAALLSSFVSTLGDANGWRALGDGDAVARAAAAALLSALASCPPFPMAVALCGAAGRRAAEALFESLRGGAGEDEAAQLASLRSHFVL